MPNTKTSALAALTAATLADTDELMVVDKSDTTMAAAGTNKKISVADLVQSIAALPRIQLSRWPGFVGDGVVDDSAAVQAAIDSLGGKRAVIEYPAATTRHASSIDAKRAILDGQGKTPNTGGGGSTLKFDGTAGVFSSLQDNTGFQIRNATIKGAGAKVTNGQVLVDMSGQNGPRLSNVRIMESHYGLRLARGATIECNYGEFEQVDIFQCTRGLDAGNGTIGANSHTFVGGRVWDCTVGWYIEAVCNNISAFGVTFECGAGEAVQSAGSNVSFFGVRWETTNVNLHALAGAGDHWMFGCHHSSGTQVVDDNAPGRVFGYSTGSAAFRFPLLGGGSNLAGNGSFLHDDGAGGPAGWLTTFSSGGGGFTFTRQSGDVTVDTYARLTNVTTSNPRAYQAIAVIPGERVAVRFKAKTSDTGFLLRLSSVGASGSDLVSQAPTSDGTWRTYGFTVTPTTAALYLIFYRNGSAAGTIDVADVVVSHGTQGLPSWQPKPLTEDGGIVYGAVELDGALDHDGTTAGFMGAAPVTRRTLGAAATDPATTQTLVNAIRQALIDLGLGQT